MQILDNRRVDSRVRFSPVLKQILPQAGGRIWSSITLLLVSTVWSSALAEEPLVVAEKPNIILINLDDADQEMLRPERLAECFPNLERFATDGIRFTNFHVTTPLCGPSRASLFRGQYAHHTNIRVNQPFSPRSNGFGGGMRLYHDQGFLHDDLSVWMQQCGYRTMMVGKFLHSDVIDLVPPGWDDFCVAYGNKYYQTSRFTNFDCPEGKNIRLADTDYRTSVEAREAITLIDRHVASNRQQPFFLCFAPFAPHATGPRSPFSMVEEKYRETLNDLEMPRDESFIEEDFSDKSTAIRNLSTKVRTLDIDENYRNRMRSVRSVDDFVALLTRKLDELELADDTYIFLTSDNGYANGRHRLIGKGSCFDHSTRVPTYVLGPGVREGAVANHLLAHIDLAPTFVELAGGTVSEKVDGRSFVELVSNPESTAPEDWREALLFENWSSIVSVGQEFNMSSFGVRFYDSVYIEWANGSPEFYDLVEDPYQIANQYDQLSPERKKELRRHIRTLRQTPINPIATIAKPFGMNSYAVPNEPFSGMAEDDQGIDSVSLVIQRLSDGKYWNGNGWEADSVTNHAELRNRGQQITTWSYDELPPVHDFAERIGVWVTATDTDGVTSSDSAFVVFGYDSKPPTCEFTTQSSVEPNGHFRVEGTAQDNDQPKHVRLFIRRSDNGSYWNGKTFVKEKSFVTAPVFGSGNWLCRSSQIRGVVDVTAIAVDRTGNEQVTPRSIQITVPAKK